MPNIGINTKSTKKKKFIVVQIDGLSQKRLNEAIQKGKAPFLKYLIQTEKYYLNDKMNCALPAATAASVSKIAYGKNPDIPDQIWFDKIKSSIGSAYSCKDVKEIEKKRKRGILQGGMGGGIPFSAEAKKMYLVVSDFGRFLFSLSKRNIEKKRLCLYLRSGIYLLFYLLITLFILLPLDFIYHLIKNTKKGSILGYAFISKVSDKHLANAVLKGEIANKNESIYINLLGYDTASHNFGPGSRVTKRALLKIDRRIRRIYNTAKQYKNLDYQVIILSDHGQIESIPFEKCFGEPLRTVLEKNLKVNVIDGRKLKNIAILNELKSMLEEFYYLRTARVLIRLINMAASYFGYNNIHLKKNSVIFIPQGDVTHIYFCRAKRKMFHGEIRKYYPELIDTLLNHDGIRFLAVSSKKGSIILDKEGREIPLNDKERIHEEDHIFATITGRHRLVSSIQEIVEMGNSGDIILFGSKIGGKTVSFDEYKASHGGIEVDEQETFVMAPSIYKNSLKGVRNLEELYPFFMNFNNCEIR